MHQNANHHKWQDNFHRRHFFLIFTLFKAWMLRSKLYLFLINRYPTFICNIYKFRFTVEIKQLVLYWHAIRNKVARFPIFKNFQVILFDIKDAIFFLRSLLLAIDFDIMRIRTELKWLLVFGMRLGRCMCHVRLFVITYICEMDGKESPCFYELRNYTLNKNRWENHCNLSLKIHTASIAKGNFFRWSHMHTYILSRLFSQRVARVICSTCYDPENIFASSKLINLLKIMFSDDAKK